LNLLGERADLDGARKVWETMAADLREPIPPVRVMPYVTYLLRNRRLEQADQVMNTLARNVPALQPQNSGNGLPIINPGFEEEYIPGPLSWILQSNSAVQVQIDSNEFHAGTRSLRLQFAGPGFRSLGISQSVRVPEHTALALSLFVKAAQIKTPIGPRLVVQDAYTNQILATGAEILGSSPWREEHLTFTSDSGLIVLRVIRDSADGSIFGTLWLDDLKVTPQ
jgi:hypothetical protein